MHLIWLANVTVWLQVFDYSQLSDYTVQINPTQWLVKNKAVKYAPIKFVEIVMVMIKSEILILTGMVWAVSSDKSKAN